jgi:hypothetical protein
VFVSDLVDSAYASRVIAQGTELRVARSGMSAEAARAAAVKDFLQTHMIVPTQRGYRSLPRLQGVTDALGEGVDWIERQLPALGRQKGLEVPAGSYLATDPTSRDNATFIVLDPMGFPVAPGVLRFPAQNIERKFREVNPTGGWKKRQVESEAETQRRARLDEFERRNPVNPLLFNTRD